MKKSVFLLSLLTACFLFAASITADRSEDPLDGQILVYTSEYPEGMLQYAYDNLERHLVSILSDGTAALSGTKVSLGHPFSIYSPNERPYAFYFPVMSDNEIVLVYTVGYDFYNMEQTGKPCFTASISENWVSELRTLCEKAKTGDPIFFYRDKNNHTMVKAGEEIIFLAYCPGVLEAPDFGAPDVPVKKLNAVSLMTPLYETDIPKDYEPSAVIRSPEDVLY